MVGARNALYDRGVLRARRLQGPVISVGNLSAGGSGKTPFVMLLGELLKARGIKFDVLSRGYGRKSKGVRLVDPAGLPQEFGDEPLLIARKLQVPVIVGEDRYEAGRFAESRFGSQLASARRRLSAPGAGARFRHCSGHAAGCERSVASLWTVARAARSRCAARMPSCCPAALRRIHFPLEGKLVWRVRRGIVPQNVPARPVVFCGIARPQNFVLQLRAANIEPVAEAFYRDHHAYSEKDVRELLALKQRSEAGGFVTTEKDAVNLGGYLSALAPLAVVPVKMDLEDAANAVDTMLQKIDERRRGA